jgi:hypothetical protein
MRQLGIRLAFPLIRRNWEETQMARGLTTSNALPHEFAQMLRTGRG